MKMTTKTSTTKSAAPKKPDVPTAKKLLNKAIDLHEKHMEGKAPVTGKAGEKSQQEMMTMMEKAAAALKGA